MNTHKNANKQGEKILLGGVAAAALGLINAKPQLVKAANQNGTRAAKKTARRAVKTKLNYQTESTETNSETEGEEATDDEPTDKTSANSSIASGSNQDTAVNDAKSNKQEIDNAPFDSANAIRDSNTTISSTWEDIPVTFNNGVLSIGEEGKSYTINNSDDKNISIGSNIDNVSGDDITEIDINAPIAIIGSAQMLFSRLTNLNTINGLDKLDTSKVTSMLRMFFDCKKIVSLDLSSFDTTNVTSFNIMFSGDPNLTSVDLSSFTVSDDATTVGMFSLIKGYTSSLTKLILGKGFKFTISNGRPNNSLQQPGTWVNMGEGNGSLTKGTNQWSSADLMTNYQGDRDHDTYVRYTGGIVTVHRQDEDGKQLVDQSGKQIPDEKLFGNISDPVTADTSKEIAGYTFKENKNSDVKAFTSDPQDITLVYSKSKTDNTWEGVPYTFNNGVLSLGEKGKTYTINNSDNKDISISQNVSGVTADDITEIDINAPIAIIGSAEMLFSRLTNLNTINGLDKLDTSKVTSMLWMFFDCKKMTSLDLSSFDTTNVTSFNVMFAADPSLTSVDLSSFTVANDATTMGMFVLPNNYTSSLTKLILGKGFKFTTRNGRPNNSLQQPGTWVNMGEGNGSLTKGTNQWSSADFMTKYQGDRDHDTYVRYTGGTVTVHRQDEQGKQLVDQDGKEIPDEKLFGNISDSVTVDTSKEFAGYKFKENKNSDIKAFISDPQTITLVYSKNETDNTWEGVPYTFNNGVLSLGEKGKTYTINNSDNKDISISQNVNGITVDDITEIDINAPIAISGSAQRLFSKLSNLVSIKGLNNLNTSQVTDMTKMFFGCTKIVSLDLSSFDTTNVTSFNTMFASDPSLTSVDLSSFTVANDATTLGMFVISEDDTPSLSKLILGKGFKFTTRNGRPNNSLGLPGTWVNMGEGNGSLTKGTNKWSSADLMTNYQGDRDHDTYVRYTGGIVTVHRQDEEGKRLVDQDGKEIPDEKLFGNISDPITVDTSKEFAGYKFKENKNSDITAFTSDPQDITLVYTKNSTTPPTPVKAKPVTVYYKYKADNGELVEIPGTNPENFPKDTTTSVVGDHVTIPFKSIEGYTPNSYRINNDNIVKSTNLPEVALAADPQFVTLIYTKTDNKGSNTVNTGTSVGSPAAIAPAVTVHYQDEYGNTIAPDRVIQGRIGDGYTTGAETVSGYALKTRPDNATGFFNNSPQSVTYVYSKSAGNTTNTTPADNTTTAENEPTPIPTSKKTKRKKAPKKTIKGLHANKQSKKGKNAPAKSIKGLIANKHQANRPAKLVAAARRLNKTASANNPQKGKQDNALPKTSTEKRSSLAMLALGSLALAAALGAAWLNRKKD